MPRKMDNEEILRIAAETIQIESDTLKGLIPALDTNFPLLVNAIFSSRGRLVVSGIGKSAIVAQKIVATLNSTGTPALFLHAADAIHGDLGMVGAHDIVVCISKSGETAEIKVLAPIVKSRGNLLGAITSGKNSYLAKQSDFVLFTPVKKEADPNNLAPTSSTTAQMAMGDALAIALLARRGFSPGDFARYHPGGALGKQLYLRVKDISQSNEKPFVHPSTTLTELIFEISSKRLGMTAVINPDTQKLLGIITDGDLRRMLSGNKRDLTVSALDIMSTDPKTVKPDTMAINALNLMKEYSITQLIVSENGFYHGVIHLHDLLREGIV